MAFAFHPYLLLTSDPFTRLTRAAFWQAADPDFRHAAYWREQVARCLGDFEASFVPHPNWPADVVERRSALHLVQSATAFRTGYELANKRRVLSVDVPGFKSGSVCNTRTLSHGETF